MPRRCPAEIALPALIVVFAPSFSVRAAEPISPQSPVNLDAWHDVAARSGFLMDTNRAFRCSSSSAILRFTIRKKPSVAGAT